MRTGRGFARLRGGNFKEAPKFASVTLQFHLDIVIPWTFSTRKIYSLEISSGRAASMNVSLNEPGHFFFLRVCIVRVKMVSEENIANLFFATKFSSMAINLDSSYLLNSS